MIAQMVSDYDAASRLLWLRAGWMKNTGRRNTRETSLAKWFSTVASERAAADAVQIHGANGYSDEYPVGRYYRNSQGRGHLRGQPRGAQGDAGRLRPRLPARQAATGRASGLNGAQGSCRRSPARVREGGRAGGHRLRPHHGHRGYGEYRPTAVAVESMRQARWRASTSTGRIVIGEGERDEAPMLFIGEKWVPAADRCRGHRRGPPRGHEPLRHRSRGGDRGPGRRREGGLLHAPGHLHGEAGRAGRRKRIASTLPPRWPTTSAGLAEALDRDVDDLVIIVLDRPRHEQLIADIRQAGARIRLIGDGDLSAGISAAVSGTGGARRHGHGREPRRAFSPPQPCDA